MMTLKKILTYIFAIIALIFEGFFGIITLIGFILQLLLIAVALWLFLSLFRRELIHQWRIFLPKSLLNMLAIIGVFIGFFLSIIGYHNYVPGVISNITLSNSGQQVVFVQMSHIATPDFYSRQHQTIEAFASSGYTILFEGVKPGTPENQALFNQAMGFDMTPTLYGEMARLMNLESQDNQKLYRDISTGSLVSVDLSIDEMIGMMGGSTGSFATGTVISLEKELQTIIPKLSSQDRIFIGWLFRGMLNWSLKQSADIDEFLVGGNKKELFTTIIDRRNDAIVDYILANPNKNIVVVYGALHFNGVYESLQKKQKGWNTTHIENISPYSR